MQNRIVETFVKHKNYTNVIVDTSNDDIGIILYIHFNVELKYISFLKRIWNYSSLTLHVTITHIGVKESLPPSWFLIVLHVCHI